MGTYRVWGKKLLILTVTMAIVAAALTAVASLGEFRVRCEDISQKVLRLHVLANSDSEEDQELKLKVRDAILEQSETLFSTSENKEEAMESVEEHKDALEAVARKTILENGYDYPVTVELKEVYFNTRTYGDITMPSGYYDAFQVKIGKAEGKNWWCVLFPSLCVPSATTVQMDEVLSPEEMEIVESDGYAVRFKVVEWYEGIVGWFR